MKKLLAFTLTLCCIPLVSFAQSKKEMIAELQNTTQLTQVLQKKVDSLERVCLKYEATIASLDSKIEKITVKLYEQAEEYEKKIKKLEENLPENKPFELITGLAAPSYSANRLLVRKGAYYGYIDREENLVVPCIYDDAESFYEIGYAAVEKNGKWGLIDSNGAVVLPIELTEIRSFALSQGYLQVNKDEKWGIYSLLDKEYVLPAKYDDIEKGCWDNGVFQFIVRDKGTEGVIDVNGKVVIPNNYRRLSWYSGSYYYDPRDMTGEYCDYHLDILGKRIKRD